MATVDTKQPAVSDDTLEMAKKEDPYKKIEDQLFKEAEMEETMLMEKARQNYKIAEDSRRRYDWEWLGRDLFRRGYQFTRYNPQTKVVTMSSAQTARIPVNLTHAAMRVIKNQVTAFRPKWEVMPNTPDEDSKDNAKYSGKTLDYVYVTNRLRKMIKETVVQGLMYSVGGPWQIGWDPTVKNDDGSYGFVYIWLTDPYDFFVDPNCTDGLAFTDAEYVIKAVRRGLQKVKANQLYKNTELITTGDNRPAASEYKQFLIQSLKQTGYQHNTSESQTIIVKEGYFKEHQKDGKVRIRLLTWVDTITKPLQNELLDTDDFPFRMYQADMNPMEVYGESWARHVIPINKVVNSLESSVFDYNYKYAKGRIVVDKNSGVRMIDNQHGNIVEKNRGADVHSLPLQPLPGSHEGQIIRMRQYFEDISGAHDVSLGRIPVGVKSGIGIAELKQADATNQDDLVDNLQDFLIESGKKVLKTLSENLDFPRLVKTTNIAGESDHFAIIGEKFAEGREREVTVAGQKLPLVVIRPDNTISVQIGSWLAYSKEQKQQELKDLYTQGVIDQRTLLEHLEFGDIDTIISRTKQERLLEARRKQQMTSQSPVSEEQLANTENKMLMLGDSRVMPMPQDDHLVHIAVHKGFENNELVNMHMQEHYAYLGRESGAEPLPPQEEPYEAQAEKIKASAEGGMNVPPAPPTEMPTQPAEGQMMPTGEQVLPVQ